MKKYGIGILMLLFVAGCKKTKVVGDQLDQQPNVLFIAVDDLNDWTGFLGGHPQALTLNMDKLTAQGMVFERAYCASPACNPSRSAIMTGILPSNSGVYGNSDYFRDSPVLTNALTIPQWFAKHGYKTLARGKIFHHPNGKWSDSISWNTKAYADGNWMNRHPNQTTTTLANGMPYVSRFEQIFDWGALSGPEEEQTMDMATANWASEQLQKGHEAPFFLACGIFRPHLPWNVPQKYYDLFPLETIQVPKILESDLEDIPPRGKDLSGGLDSNKDYQRIKRHYLFKEAVQAYLASIAYADACVGRVLESLEQSPYADNTIVVLWGDHGWNLGEKLHYRKFVLWEESARVPLIIKAPNLTESGSVSRRTVNLLDLYPTLSELAGIPVNPKNEGRSLVPLLKNPIATWNYPSLTTLGPNDHSVRDENFRYIRYADGTEELYDHVNDPMEWKNIADYPGFLHVKEALAEWIPKESAPSVSGNLDPRGTDLDRKAPKKVVKYE